MRIVKLVNGERIIAPPDSIKIKSRLVVLEPDKSVGIHETTGKEEIIFVISGMASVWENGEEKNVDAGHAVYISPGVKHDIINRTDRPLKYIYVTVPVE